MSIFITVRCKYSYDYAHATNINVGVRRVRGMEGAIQERCKIREVRDTRGTKGTRGMNSGAK